MWRSRFPSRSRHKDKETRRPGAFELPVSLSPCLLLVIRGSIFAHFTKVFLQLAFLPVLTVKSLIRAIAFLHAIASTTSLNDASAECVSTKFAMAHTSQ